MDNITDSHAILDAIQHPVILIDDGVLVYGNTSSISLFGKEIGAHLQRPFAELVVPGDRKNITDYFKKLFIKDSQKSSHKIECTIKTSKGQDIRLEMQASLFFFQNKKMALCSLVDITSLAKAYTQLPRILDIIPETIFTFSPDHKRILSATNACEGIYGIPRDQFTNNVFHPIDLVLPEDTERVKQFYQNLIANEFDSIEYRIVHTNGETLWLHDEGEVVYKEHGMGEIYFVYHFIRDITERKQKDERLQASEERYRRIFERSTNPIFIVTRQGKFLDLNNSAIEVFEFANREEALQEDVHNLFFHKTQLENILEVIEKNGSITDEPIQLVTKTSRVIDVVFSAGGRKSSKSGNIEQFQVLLHDPRAIIKRTELETYRRTLGGISDRINNIAQAQMMQQGLIWDCLYDLDLKKTEQKNIQTELEMALAVTEKSSHDLAALGETVRKLYHNPKPPKPVSDGAGGILFDLTS